jgi:hypothetical protein
MRAHCGGLLQVLQAGKPAAYVLLNLIRPRLEAGGTRHRTRVGMHNQISLEYATVSLASSWEIFISFN